MLAPGSSPETVNGPAPVRWTDIVAISKVHPSPDRSEMPAPLTVRREFHRSAKEPPPETEIRQYSPSISAMRLPSGSQRRTMPLPSVRTSFMPYPTVPPLPSSMGMSAVTGESARPMSTSTG